MQRRHIFCASVNLIVGLSWQPGKRFMSSQFHVADRDAGGLPWSFVLYVLRLTALAHAPELLPRVPLQTLA